MNAVSPFRGHTKRGSSARSYVFRSPRDRGCRSALSFLSPLPPPHCCSLLHQPSRLLKAFDRVSIVQSQKHLQLIHATLLVRAARRSRSALEALNFSRCTRHAEVIWSCPCRSSDSMSSGKNGTRRLEQIRLAAFQAVSKACCTSGP
jgi:hypothetical protein